MTDRSTPVATQYAPGRAPARRARWPLVVAAMACAVAAAGYVPPASNLSNVGWDTWVPQPGYRWVDANRPHQGVRWQPGSAHPEVPHLLASDEAKLWVAEAGYGFVDPANLRAGVQWQPGLEHREFANIVANAQEGRWQTRPGYRFERPNMLSPAVWAPGVGHPDFPNIVAGEKPGVWTPQVGYEWVSREPGDLRVAAVQQQDRATQFFTGLVKVMLGAGMAREQSDDGIVTRSVVRPLGSAIREDGLRDMAGALAAR
jgi:hypothetical protein